MFNGLTGAAMSTVNYEPARGNVCQWGDTYGNRVDRFLAGTAYLDGQRPSLIMARGYYTRATIAAWDFRNGSLTRRWTLRLRQQQRRRVRPGQPQPVGGRRRRRRPARDHLRLGRRSTTTAPSCTPPASRPRRRPARRRPRARAGPGWRCSPSTSPATSPPPTCMTPAPAQVIFQRPNNGGVRGPRPRRGRRHLRRQRRRRVLGRRHRT